MKKPMATRKRYAKIDEGQLDRALSDILMVVSGALFVMTLDTVWRLI